LVAESGTEWVEALASLLASLMAAGLDMALVVGLVGESEKNLVLLKDALTVDESGKNLVVEKDVIMVDEMVLM